MKLAWSATDGGTGVSEYGLHQSTNGGSFASVPIASTSAVSKRLLSPGNTYQFRMQAKNQAGSWSDWVKEPTFVVSDYQELSNAIAYLGT